MYMAIPGTEPHQISQIRYLDDKLLYSVASRAHTDHSKRIVFKKTGLVVTAALIQYYTRLPRCPGGQVPDPGLC